MINTLYTNFQHWSNGKGLYIISDTHFSDEDREYMGYHISEEEQIDIIKKKCRGQCLIHLGDVGNPEYMKKIKAYKVLIMGNHDVSASKFYPFFDEIYTGPIWIAEKLVLSHEAINLTSCVTGNPIAFNIHGHDHGNNYIDDYHLNLCQNIVNYEPLNLGDFIKSGKLKTVKSIHREIIDNAGGRNSI